MSRKASIDLGLDVIETVRRPGERLSERDVAEVCGCSRQRIRELKLRALEKMRKRGAELKAEDNLEGRAA